MSRQSVIDSRAGLPPSLLRNGPLGETRHPRSRSPGATLKIAVSPSYSLYFLSTRKPRNVASPKRLTMSLVRMSPLTYSYYWPLWPQACLLVFSLNRPLLLFANTHPTWEGWEGFLISRLYPYRCAPARQPCPYPLILLYTILANLPHSSSRRCSYKVPGTGQCCQPSRFYAATDCLRN